MGRAAFGNKHALLAGAALLVLAMTTPAGAREVPNGSYLQSCRNIEIHGDTLVADCLRVDGRWSRSGLDVGRCRGDIANNNGELVCPRRDHDHRYDDDRRGPYDR